MAQKSKQVITKRVITKRVSPKIPEPGSVEKSKPVGLILTKIMTQAGAFITMVRASTDADSKRFNIKDIVLDWWDTAFPITPFPEGGLNAYEAVVAVQYRLALNGYRKYNVEPPERFKKNYRAAVNFWGDEAFADPSLRAAERLNDLSQITIYKNYTEGENIMARKKTTKKATPEKTVSKKTVSKKTVSKKTASKSTEGVETIRTIIRRCVSGRKMTDDQIAKEILKSHDAANPARNIKAVRDRINAGGDSVIEQPKTPYKEIGGKPTPEKTPSVPAKKTAAKKTATKETVGKKETKKPIAKRVIKKRNK